MPFVCGNKANIGLSEDKKWFIDKSVFSEEMDGIYHIIKVDTILANLKTLNTEHPQLALTIMRNP